MSYSPLGSAAPSIPCSGPCLLLLVVQAFLDIAGKVRLSDAPELADGKARDAFLREQFIYEGTPDSEALSDLLRTEQSFAFALY
jgi:hypothetical protein